MKKSLVALLVLFQLTVFSQEKSGHNFYWNDYNEYEAIIGAKNCYVREKPTIQSQLLDSLQIGKKIKVFKSSDGDSAINDLKINGLNVSWAQIEYKNKKGETVTGFLWKGFIAVGFIEKDDYTYLTTIDKVVEKNVSDDYKEENFVISVKILDTTNTILAQKSITKMLNGSFFFENKTIGSLGLKNLENIYRISFSGEACGIPTLYYYFGWNGTTFLELPEKYSVGDAGVFYYTENFVFPKESGGKPDLIFKKIEQAEYDENAEKNNVYILNVTNWTETYKWNGQKAIFVSKSKPIKSKRTEN